MSDKRTTFDVIFDLAEENIKYVIHNLPADEAYERVMTIIGDLLVEQAKQIDDDYGLG